MLAFLLQVPPTGFSKIGPHTTSQAEPKLMETSCLSVPSVAGIPDMNHHTYLTHHWPT